MALTRKMLKAMGIEDEKVDQIIEAHTEVTDAIKADRDRYKADSEKLAEVQNELDILKGGEDWKTKYETEHKSFEDYKNSIEQEKTLSEKKALYRQLLVDSKVDEKRLDAILKVTDISGLSVKDGKLENAEDLAKSIKTEWAGFILKDKVEGAKVGNPPAGEDGGKESRKSGRAAELAKKYNELHYGKKEK